jgi:quercetin dioxygenase-like cupin family protein
VSEKNEFPTVSTGEGVTRRVLSHNEELMTVEFAFKKDGVGELHNHPHIQSTFVKEGIFAFSVDGKEQRLEAGDSIIIPGNAVHGCTALEDGILIDTFTPRRDDFL